MGRGGVVGKNPPGWELLEKRMAGLSLGSRLCFCFEIVRQETHGDADFKVQ